MGRFDSASERSIWLDQIDPTNQLIDLKMNPYTPINHSMVLEDYD